MSLFGERSAATWTAVGGVCAVITVVISLIQIAQPDGPAQPDPGRVTALEPESTPTAGPEEGGPVEPPPPPPPSGAPLDYSLDATYFTEEAVAGFPGDPLGFPVTSGGSVDVSALGEGCRGFAARAPDFQLTWDGRGELLRFFFAGDGDTALVVNAPSATWHCNDDSNGGLNPTVDFPAAADGTYDVWVASVSSGASISGTLFVTELQSQVPPS